MNSIFFMNIFPQKFSKSFDFIWEMLFSSLYSPVMWGIWYTKKIIFISFYCIQFSKKNSRAALLFNKSWLEEKILIIKFLHRDCSPFYKVLRNQQINKFQILQVILKTLLKLKYHFNFFIKIKCSLEIFPKCIKF